MQPLIPIQQAEDIISSNLPILGQEMVALENATHRTLAAPIVADRTIPPYDRVMMDGIAIHYDSFAQGRRDFTIAGTQAAGMPPLSLDDQQQCLEVMTGAPLPHGCDCVIKIEDTHCTAQLAQLAASCTVNKNQHIHPQGSDKKIAEVLVRPGSLLTAPELAIAASVGQIKLSVLRTPQILLITTGDEVIPPDQTPLPHQIRRSHATAISASIHQLQLGKITHTHVPDSPEALEQCLKNGLQNYDLILLTGGISMGKFDYVAPVLKPLAGEPLFHGIAQRPGKPFAFWSAEIPIFALPGNPASVMACLARYIIPALRKIHKESWQPSHHPLGTDVTWNAPFPGLLAAQITNNQIHVKPPRNSGDYTALAGSQGICELPHSSVADTPVPFYPW